MLKQELESQRRAQLNLLSRLERLEQRQRTLEARLSGKQGAASTHPGEDDSTLRHQLPVVRLEPQHNPVMDAPEIPTSTELVISSEDLAKYGDNSEAAVDLADFVEHDTPEGDLAFSLALQKYNLGDRQEAAGDLRRFSSRFPRHSSADNALYLAGMAMVSQGRCDLARADFEKVSDHYPDTDAAPSAMLALGQCEAALGRKDLAREILEQVIRKHPQSHEATQARSALQNLSGTGSLHLERKTGKWAALWQR